MNAANPDPVALAPRVVDFELVDMTDIQQLVFSPGHSHAQIMTLRVKNPSAATELALPYKAGMPMLQLSIPKGILKAPGGVVSGSPQFRCEHFAVGNVDRFDLTPTGRTALFIPAASELIVTLEGIIADPASRTHRANVVLDAWYRGAGRRRQKATVEQSLLVAEVARGTSPFDMGFQSGDHVVCDGVTRSMLWIAVRNVSGRDLPIRPGPDGTRFVISIETSPDDSSRPDALVKAAEVNKIKVSSVVRGRSGDELGYFKARKAASQPRDGHTWELLAERLATTPKNWKGGDWIRFRLDGIVTDMPIGATPITVTALGWDTGDATTTLLARKSQLVHRLQQVTAPGQPLAPPVNFRPDLGLEQLLFRDRGDTAGVRLGRWSQGLRLDVVDRNDRVKTGGTLRLGVTAGRLVIENIDAAGTVQGPSMLTVEKGGKLRTTSVAAKKVTTEFLEVGPEAKIDGSGTITAPMLRAKSLVLRDDSGLPSPIEAGVLTTNDVRTLALRISGSGGRDHGTSVTGLLVGSVDANGKLLAGPASAGVAASKVAKETGHYTLTLDEPGSGHVWVVVGSGAATSGESSGGFYLGKLIVSFQVTGRTVDVKIHTDAGHSIDAPFSFVALQIPVA